MRSHVRTFDKLIAHIRLRQSAGCLLPGFGEIASPQVRP